MSVDVAPVQRPSRYGEKRYPAVLSSVRLCKLILVLRDHRTPMTVSDALCELQDRYGIATTYTTVWRDLATLVDNGLAIRSGSRSRIGWVFTLTLGVRK